MKNKNLKNLYLSVSFLFVFALWTFLLEHIDVEAIGPNGSFVGFSTLNSLFHKTFGVHFTLYFITDWLGLVAVFFMFFFAALGLFQWIKRKNILKVDFSLLVLGGFYLLLLAVYLLFEELAINYRPVLINNFLEASYPSSTTLLVMTVLPTTILQFKERIKRPLLKRIVLTSLSLFTAFMVMGRLFSGVHWLSDIIGGALLGLGLVFLYRFAVGLKE